MDYALPHRPHLDQLRKQAKALLHQLHGGDPEAADTFRQFLPAAARLTPEAIRAAGYRLADAQAAIARKTGFAGWPQLSRHVECLRALEGTWSFQRLEIEGQTVPASALSASRICIDGDRFRTESPEATYEGVFLIDVDASPQTIDIAFVEGPEAGRTNYGIFRCEGEVLELCLDMRGGARPGVFRTTPGSGHACETLRRSSAARPADVSGGQAPAPAPNPATPARHDDPESFARGGSPLPPPLQGVWGAVEIVRDGQPLPAFLLSTGRREASASRVKISVGGAVIIDAFVRLNEAASTIDYLHASGPAKGALQQGLFRMEGDVACFCMGAPGGDRPRDFEVGQGRTLSRWRRAT